MHSFIFVSKEVELVNLPFTSLTIFFLILVERKKKKLIMDCRLLIRVYVGAASGLMENKRHLA